MGNNPKLEASIIPKKVYKGEKNQNTHSWVSESIQKMGKLAEMDDYMTDVWNI